MDESCILLKKPLSDHDCEKAVLGTLIVHGWAFLCENKRLEEDLFDDFLHKTCMRVIIKNNREGKPFDVQTVYWDMHTQYDGVNRKDVEDLLSFTLDDKDLFSSYVDRLSEYRCLRRMYEMTKEVMNLCHAPQPGRVLPLIGKLRNDLDNMVTANMPGGDSSLSQEVDVFEKFIRMRQEGKTGKAGTATGFKELDSGGGFLPGQLIILGGATSHGKSALALTFARNAIRQNRVVAYYSMEMSKQQLCSRFAAMESGVSSNRLLHPEKKLSEQDFNRVICESIPALRSHGDNLRFDDDVSADIDRIAMSIRSLHYRYHLDGVIIDYLQILRPSRFDMQREQFLASVSRLLKNLALELDIWILALSQFNRSVDGTPPTLDRIRDSGQIAEAADAVILLHRPEAAGGIAYPAPFDHHMVKGTAMINLAKNRNGGTEKFLVKFNKERTLFSSMTDDEFNNLQTVNTTFKRNGIRQRFYDVSQV